MPDEKIKDFWEQKGAADKNGLPVTHEDLDFLRRIITSEG